MLEVSGVSCSFLGGKSLGAAGVVGSVSKKTGEGLSGGFGSEFLDFLDTVERGSGVSCSEGRKVSRFPGGGRAVLGRTLRRVLVYTSLEVLYG